MTPDTHTTDAPALPYEITADDIAALRLANSVSFHYYRGNGHIRASTRAALPPAVRVYTAREQRVFSTADASERYRDLAVSTTMRGYGGGWTGGPERAWNLDTEPNASAFHMLTSPEFDRDWQTIVSLLKAGDVLTLAWVADNNNEILRGAGLHCDELRLVVKRGERELSFLLEATASLDNSARMVRKHDRG